MIKYNFNNKNIFVTGANSGIGFSFCKQIINDNPNLYMCCRNTKKANEAKAELLKINPNANIKILEIDLSDLDSITKFCDYIITNKIDVDVFYNNAGIYRIKDKFTKQGFELVMGTNFIGTFYLSILLIPYLLSLNHNIKYLITTSLTGFLYKLPKHGLFDKSKDSLKVYGQSKRAIIHLFMYLLDKYHSSNIDFKLVHPGVCYTSIIDKGYKSKGFVKLAKAFMNLMFNNVDTSAKNSITAISENGLFYGPIKMFGFKGEGKEIPIKLKYTKGYLETIKQAFILVNNIEK